MNPIDSQAEALLNRMTLAEKIGQMRQISGFAPDHVETVRQGRAGSFLNVLGADPETLQRVARQETRLGIPLIFGRDVIHGFKTVLPIPLGQAASFNPDLVREAAQMAAREAASSGIHWTFAPMVDVARDPRWGRIAEGYGEDPFLASRMGAATVEGFQQAPAGGYRRRTPAVPGIAACPKHYVGYGAAESGRDYNTTLIPERTLRSVYLPPFQACVKAGALTVMSAFNELNDIPATGHQFTLRQILKREWRFRGFVVSDWGSVVEMIQHGYCADAREAARTALRAGVDMEMVSTAFADHLEALVTEGQVPMAWIEEAVRRILRVKLLLGLFNPERRSTPNPSVQGSPEHLQMAYRAAVESCVLLKNEGVLPLPPSLRSVAVVGPLADSPTDQLGCWAPDGDPRLTQTVLQALQECFGEAYVRYAPGVRSCRDPDSSQIPAAVDAVRNAEVAILCVGEDAGLSGEAHCRAFLNLPGAQEQLVAEVASTGRPVILVIMAGRPLVLGPILPIARAVLWAWHPGTMGGAAIAALLTGRESPSGCLPVSFPRAVGQIPIYYNHKNTGRPAPAGIREAPTGTPIDPKDFTARHLDVDVTPEFPFGFGLSYTQFRYGPTRLDRTRATALDTIRATASVTNVGRQKGATVAQLYIRDPVASATRPVRELKGFQKIWLEPGQSCEVSFEIGPGELAAYDAEMRWRVEPGRFLLWIASDSTCAGLSPAELDVRDM